MRLNKKLLRGCGAAMLVATAVIGGGPPAGGAGGAAQPPRPRGAGPPAGFTDVPADDVHHDAVDCMVWWHVANGTGAHTYNPAGQVNRGQMASFLARMI